MTNTFSVRVSSGTTYGLNNVFTVGGQMSIPYKYNYSLTYVGDPNIAWIWSYT